MKNKFSRFITVVILAAGLIIISVGCSSQQGSSRQLKIGIQSFASYTALQVALEEGLFAREGLEVEFVSMAGGAELLPAVEAGELDFTATNLISPIAARAQGFPFVFIAFNESTRSNPPDGGVLLAKKGKITDIKQLEGGTVAVNNLQNVAWLTVIGALDKKGVDVKKVKFLEVPFPQIGDAILNDQVDAGFDVEPFSSGFIKTGKFDVMSYPYVEYMPDVPLGAFVATEKWLKANGEIAEKFAQALNEATEMLNKVDREKALQYVANFTGAKVEGLEGTILPYWKTRFTPDSLQRLADMMLDHGILQQRVETKPMLYNLDSRHLITRR